MQGIQFLALGTLPRLEFRFFDSIFFCTIRDACDGFRPRRTIQPVHENAVAGEEQRGRQDAQQGKQGKEHLPERQPLGPSTVEISTDLLPLVKSEQGKQ